MVTRRQTLGLIGASAIAAGLPFTGGARAATPKTLRIGWQKGGILALAKSQGALEKLFASRGISITWSEFSSGPPLLEALGAGALDFGPTGDVPPLFAQAARGNLVYAGTYKGSAEGSAILVRKDSPIQTLQDLKGKKLAFKRGSSAHNVAVKVLRKGGLALTDVTQVDLAPADAAAAFKNGSIDAWSIWDPFTAVAQADPQTRVLTTAKGIVESWSFFLANGDFAKANPDVITDIIKELARFGKEAQTNLEATIPALSEITGVPQDITRVTLTRSDSNLGDVATISDAAIAYQQSLADEFFDLKIIPRKLTISDIVWRPKAS
ncbi:aliphatic sulfonate ABC transporter substrate-binding protein [Rhizobium oryzicola]|uniref:Aliphatic sulfonate ABC transporter substrate-binding protein n=1 Tax=Rhizobium oryzicola TaxID=1232668 RepID=A0ABT8T2X9_9HYPH|nr:aliphatic sulfonate ABC transporter substrate-binding protein [Rhizobium oryzicola]MDO1584643.1 aliphatic sulfonate ABC transporter substrate-binding protein [Rhizobium oryzicola]